MLLLFDIDGTLLSTTGCGASAMQHAARSCFGDHISFEGISVAGRLDPLILADVFAKHGVADTPEHHAKVRSVYLGALEERLANAAKAMALPGVHELLGMLVPHASRGAAIMALLTGNFEESGLMKLERCGIEPWMFAFGVYGEHARTSPPRREDLVPVGMERAARLRGRATRPEEVVIIGDTPADVRCALEHGGRCLAVATGHFSVADLQAAGAHWVVEDLTQTDRIVEWLLNAG
ncbi:MAG: HAD hydrolase-like protein [Planctomycetota bacterium]|nr:HAD hydrolase-like protein [Planctomycetota bacterium]